MQSSKKEQRGVTQILAAEIVGDREMHRQMKTVYGSSCHHTGNDCRSDCLSFGQPHNQSGRDTLVTGYYLGHHSHHNVSDLELSKSLNAWVPH
ncbi:hypothetical protein TNCV_3210721 [Trichonephila clavipes]|nr:hypothetical protein TNCV_3210721 [Trichonephila clavipes]